VQGRRSQTGGVHLDPCSRGHEGCPGSWGCGENSPLKRLGDCALGGVAERRQAPQPYMFRLGCIRRSPYA
jgi:hypothetical protein